MFNIKRFIPVLFVLLARPLYCDNYKIKFVNNETQKPMIEWEIFCNGRAIYLTDNEGIITLDEKYINKDIFIYNGAKIAKVFISDASQLSNEKINILKVSFKKIEDINEIIASDVNSIFYNKKDETAWVYNSISSITDEIINEPLSDKLTVDDKEVIKQLSHSFNSLPFSNKSKAELVNDYVSIINTNTGIQEIEISE